MPHPHSVIRRTTTAALPAAIAGSLALSLAAAPAAHAENRAEQVRTRQAPTTPERAEQIDGVARVSGLDGALAAAVAAAGLSEAARRTPTTHTVVRGDTIFGIARHYGLSTADVLSWNGLSHSTVIHPGQKIRLTPPSGSAKASVAKKTTKKATASRAYTVRAGDTISGIARAHGLSTQTLLNANGLRWSSIIYPGQKLSVPGTAAAAASTSSSSSSTKRKAAQSTKSTSSGTVQPGQRYTVRAGDTMSAIASRHGVGVAALLKANGMDFSSIIYPGQSIKIPTSGIPGLSTEQAANARLIVRVGRQLGVSDRGIAIALGTAMQESGLRNLDYGDRDSLGLFQQRPSTGWGTAAQVRDAERATRAFFGGPSDPNGSRTNGLLDIAGWQKMSFTEAAQAVQISAYPTRYAQWEKPAFAWLAAIK